jgi:hypothetical protein
VSDDAGVRILTAYRAPDRVVGGLCPMCERERQIAFEITVAHGAGSFDVWSVCDECAPRAARLLGWLGGEMAG